MTTNDNATYAASFPRAMIRIVGTAKYWAGTSTRTVGAILGVRDPSEPKKNPNLGHADQSGALANRHAIARFVVDGPQSRLELAQSTGIRSTWPFNL
jgi:hypothetical protein